MERAEKIRHFATGANTARGSSPPPRDSALAAYVRCLRDGRIEAANDTLAAWLGLPAAASLVGRSFPSFAAIESLWQAWRDLGAPRVCRFELKDTEGGQRPVRAEVRPTDVPGGFDIWMIEDLANEMITRVARLEAALTLTSGTLHDVNNVLTVLGGNLFLLTESVRNQPKLYEQARRSRNAASRGSTLLRELQTYSREVDGEAKSLSPRAHVVALQPLLLRMVRAGNADRDLKVRVDSRSGSVIASAARFESVVINLVINARDALKGNGLIHVRVCHADIDEHRARTLGVRTGAYVCLRVVDNGAGIPASNLERVTEPLFSTKGRDRGCGLGLAMVRHFAESNGGALRIESVEGRGTRVSVWLPCTERLAETTANMTLPLSTLPGGDEKLLLLSRDGEVRSSLQQILETLGYTVLVAADMEQVRRVLDTATPPALIISERSADALRIEKRWLEDLRDSYPGVRHLALLQIGASAVEVAPDSDGYVYRPVGVPELARTVRNILEKP